MLRMAGDSGESRRRKRKMECRKRLSRAVHEASRRTECGRRLALGR